MLKKMKVLVPVLAIVALIMGTAINAEAKKGVTLSGTVNINSANVEELTLLPGVGPSKAAQIVSYRETKTFDSVEELMKVKGIGQKLFDSLRAYATTDGPTTAKLVKDASLKQETPTAGGES